MGRTTVPILPTIKKVANKFVVILLVCIALCACKPKVNDFSVYTNIEPSGWKYGQSYDFEPVQQDSIVSGRLKLNVRHTGDYSYRNLWLEVTLRDSVIERVDTVNLLLADPFGNWFGTGVGTDFQLSSTLADTIRLCPPVKISVRHIMRSDDLKGIEQIGLDFTEL